MMATAWADTRTELSTCCCAQVSYSGDGDLYCKSCYGAVEWTEHPICPKCNGQILPGDLVSFTGFDPPEGIVIAPDAIVAHDGPCPERG